MKIPARALTALLCLAPLGAAQDPAAPPANGPRSLDIGWHRLVNVTLHPRPGEVQESAYVVLRDGEVTAVGAYTGDGFDWAAVGAEGAREWDLAEHHVYPGFLDAYVEVDAPAPDPAAPETHWNEKVTPRRSALDGDGLTDDQASSLRKLGFTACAVSPSGGIFRGSAAVVSLAEPPAADSGTRPPVYADDVYQTVAFERWSFRDRRDRQGLGAYPDSQMGAIALVRQTFCDVEHFREPENRRDPRASSLEPLLGGADDDGPRFLFDAANELEALRAARVAREFGKPALVLGSGTELRRLDAVKATGLDWILPLQFPDAPDVSSIGAEQTVDLADLMMWEQAPTNPRRLDEAGVRVALTTARLRQNGDFHGNLRKAIEHGLAEDRALAMLTTQPAALLGLEDTHGEVAPGRVANLVVTDGPLFDEDTELTAVWIDGRRHELKSAPRNELEGVWAVTLEPAIEDPITFTFREGNKLTIETRGEEAKAKSLTFEDDRLSFVFDHEPFGTPGMFMISGLVSGDRMTGSGKRSGGERFAWTATRTSTEVAAAGDEQGRRKPDGDDEEGDGEDGEDEDEDEEKRDLAADVPERLRLPFGPYAYDAQPDQPAVVVVTGATIWTSGPQGRVENGTLVVEAGKVAQVVSGSFLAPAGAVVVNAAGKHVTPGLIDCHSHTGISNGVNESGQTVTAEVRIGDVTDPDSIHWYRELAGGLTAANCLHGSANPIGGQNQVVKLRWGAARPNDMHFEGASPGIKFALGENVKQSNWGDDFRVRYPQTRMGVETMMRDRFNAARDYAATWEAWKGSGDLAGAPHRDLELEALAEILAGERLIHCHSYRQDEILMLCRIAGDYGFTIGTFQHVLEGYKVAEAIREHALGGSAFSDWWAYKVEVQDAIPYAGAIMHEAGVCVSFNSDSNELARRMNIEAAKAVRYGGVPPEEALKFVTLNPAKQLRVDHRVGSLEAGKDADFVIWSGDPLSTYSRCLSTWIDGREYFSIDKDSELRERDAAERRRLVQKVLASGEKPRGGGRGGRGGPGYEYTEEQVEHYLERLRAGLPPMEQGCGDCGMIDLHLHHKH